MGLFRRLITRRSASAIVLLYHRVGDVNVDPWGLCVSPDHFAEHLQVLRDQWLPVPLPHLAQKLGRGDRSRAPVAVTFDDGYADNLTSAYPLLERYDVPASFFLTTGWMDQHAEFWWDALERLLLQPGTLPATLSITVDGRSERWELGEDRPYGPEAVERDRSWRAWEEARNARHAIYYAIWQRLYAMQPDQRESALRELLESAAAEHAPRPTHRALTLEEVAALARGKLVEIGAHTVNHPPLSRIPIAAQEQEIERGKAELERAIDRPVTSFAYPHGDYSRETVPLVREAGFRRACSTRSELVGPGSPRFELPRFSVGDWDGDEFAKQLSAWQRKARA